MRGYLKAGGERTSGNNIEPDSETVPIKHSDFLSNEEMTSAIPNDRPGGLIAGTDKSGLPTAESVSKDPEIDKNSLNPVALNTKDNSSAEQSRKSDRPQRDKKLPSHLKSYILDLVQSKNPASMTLSTVTRSSVFSVSSEPKEVFDCIPQGLNICKRMEIVS